MGWREGESTAPKKRKELLPERTALHQALSPSQRIHEEQHYSARVVVLELRGSPLTNIWGMTTKNTKKASGERARQKKPAPSAPSSSPTFFRLNESVILRSLNGPSLAKRRVGACRGL